MITREVAWGARRIAHDQLLQPFMNRVYEVSREYVPDIFTGTVCKVVLVHLIGPSSEAVLGFRDTTLTRKARDLVTSLVREIEGFTKDRAERRFILALVLERLTRQVVAKAQEQLQENFRVPEATVSGEERL